MSGFQPNVTTLRLTNGTANPSVCLSSVVSVVCDVRAPYSGGLTFWGYFAPYCSLAIRQLTHQKSRRSSEWIILAEDGGRDQSKTGKSRPFGGQLDNRAPTTTVTINHYQEIMCGEFIGTTFNDLDLSLTRISGGQTCESGISPPISLLIYTLDL